MELALDAQASRPNARVRASIERRESAPKTTYFPATAGLDESVCLQINRPRRFARQP